jgi:DNA topoisomerase-1
VRESTKYEHVVAFADALPAIREKSKSIWPCADCRAKRYWRPSSTFWRPRSSASETTKYAERNNSYGLTTLQNRHVAVDGNEVRFRFTGKSGKQWSLRVRDRRIAKIIKACQELPEIAPVCG